jgi:hypothetical protein
MNGQPRSPSQIDNLTLIAMTAIAYILANGVHEGIGHGGACLVTGGRCVALSAVFFECDKSALSSLAQRWIAASGTLANLALGALALLLLARSSRRVTPTGYFLWLLMTVNLLQGAGYLLFSGVANIGDWAQVIRGAEPSWLWRTSLIVAGGAVYWGVIRISLRQLVPFLGESRGRVRRATLLSLVPYLAGGLVYLVAGLPNPLGLWLVLISAAAAAFGGTSALAWMTQLLRNERRYPPSPAAALSIPRSRAWLVAGALTVLLFVGVLGPSIRF